MAGIKLGDFRGARPRQSSRLLEPREGQKAIDVRLGSGELRPLRALTTDGAWAKSGVIKSFFAYEHPTAGRLWLHWPDVVDVVPGPNVNDDATRIYYTGDGLPKMSFADLVDAGEGEMGDTAPGEFPREWRLLGIPAPPALDIEDLEFTAPNLGGTLTNFTGPVEFENGVTQAYWDNLDYQPLSIAWTTAASKTPAEFEIDFTPGDEFIVEVESTTAVRLSAFGRDYLTPSTLRIIDIPPQYEGTIVAAIYGNFLTRPNADGTGPNPILGGVGHNNVVGFTQLRPQNRILVDFPVPHGLSDGEIIRITAVPTNPIGTGALVFNDLSVGTLAEPAFWKSSTQMTWTGEVEYEVIREGANTPTGTVEDRAYVYTYVSDLGEEGPPSDPTEAVTVTTSGGVLLTGFSVPVFPNRVISHIRVYRADTNDSNAEFRFVVEIPMTDINDYTPPDPGDPVETGGVLALSPPAAALSTMSPTTVQLNSPAASLTTAATTVTLSARISDYDDVLNSLAPLDWVAPSWTLQFQVSLDNSIWVDVGAPKVLTGSVTNFIEDTIPLEYTSFFVLNATATETYDASAATNGDPLYFRAVVTYGSGRSSAPFLDLFTAAEPVAAPPFGFAPTTDYSYLDLLLSYQLGEVLPSDTWFPPATTMHSLVTMPSGVLVGAYGRTVAFCEPYRPHAWPPEYEQAIDYDVVGFGVFGNSVLVCTTGTPYVMTGTHPRNISMRRIEVNQACVSKRSIANVGVGVLYATPDGLGFASQQGFRLITDGHFSREEWQALEPETMIGFSHDEKYICFLNPTGAGTSGAFVFDPQRPEIGLSFTTDEDILGGFEDLLTDKLFLTDGTNRLTWDTGSVRTYTWRSKLLSMPYALNPAAARVLADVYPVTFKLYGDGVLRHTRTVANKEAFRLPSGYLSNEFEVELTSNKSIKNVWVGETFSEVLEG